MADGVLADALFRRLVHELPEDARYERPESGPDRGSPVAERAILPLARLDTSAESAWRDVAAALAAPEVRAAWLERLGVSWRRGDGEALRSQAFLSRDFTPYAIGPHTDVPRRVLSMILYLSPASAPESWGTTLFRPREAGFECARGQHYGFEGFVPAQVVPFRPNRAVVFARSNRSFHGLMPIAAAAEPRDTLLYEIMR